VLILLRWCNNNNKDFLREFLQILWINQYNKLILVFPITCNSLVKRCLNKHHILLLHLKSNIKCSSNSSSRFNNNRTQGNINNKANFQILGVEHQCLQVLNHSLEHQVIQVSQLLVQQLRSMSKREVDLCSNIKTLKQLKSTSNVITSLRLR